MRMGRKIVIVRHGERVDLTFGHNWTDKAMDSEGNYTKLNLNMPDVLVKREGIPGSYKGDSPLTQIGHTQGFLVGKGLREQSVLRPGFTTYVSPSLRSIQTASELLRGMEEFSDSAILKVEPTLFEWTGFYAEGIPRWLSLEELTSAGFSIDMGYQPYMKATALIPNESTLCYYTRSYELVQGLLEKHREDTKDILLVAHGITVDAATRILFGQPARSTEEMLEMLQISQVPYAGLGILQQEEGLKEGQDERGSEAGGKWRFIPPGPVTMKHSACHDFQADQVFPN